MTDSDRGARRPLTAGELRQLEQVQERLSEAVGKLTFAAPVTHVYNPLGYAREMSIQYLQRYVAIHGDRRLLLGMNPGPWGMAQTGVPFGSVDYVRDWLKLDAPVGRPPLEHPKRPVRGLDCPRIEVSGSRLWGWAAEDYGTAPSFFDRYVVWNYCPLSFMKSTGANLTPDKLPAAERSPLFAACDAALHSVVELLGIHQLIGVGLFAEKRLRHLFADRLQEGSVHIGRISHPSPASPKANAGWPDLIRRELASFP